MQSPNPDHETTHPAPNEGATRTQSLLRDPKSFSGFVGYLLLGVSAAFGFTTIFLRRNSAPFNATPSHGSELGWFLSHYTETILAFLLVIFFALIGLQLLGAAGKITPKAIPPEDRALLEPLVRDAKKDAITQYVILSSLGGFTGTFQKIGFSGLPLATSILTLLFCALSFANRDFLEFAKLTLGAFIGSFVQRSADSERLTRIGSSDTSHSRDPM